MPELENLLEQRRRIDAAIRSARKEAAKAAAHEITDMLRGRGLPLDSVVAILQRKVRGAPVKKAKNPASVGQPRYRDPDTGRTWTGRGRPPTWWNKDLPLIGQD